MEKSDAAATQAFTPVSQRTNTAIAREIREAFRLVFGVAADAEQRAFSEKYDAFVDYATAASAPILSADTVRYQTVLLTLSLVFVSVSLFEFNSVRLFDALVKVDRSLLIIYAAFIIAVGLLFLVKAYVDYERAKFVRDKNAKTTIDVRRAIELRMARRNIQLYFWTELSNTIARAYHASRKALSSAMGITPDEGVEPIQFIELDFDALSTIPELDAEVSRCRAVVGQMSSHLAGAEVAFQKELQALVEQHRQRGRHSDWEHSGPPYLDDVVLGGGSTGGRTG